MKTNIVVQWAFTVAVLVGSALGSRAQTPGTIHTNFVPTSGADAQVRALARQADGRLFVAGQFTMFNGVPRNRIARLNYDGSTDTTFDPGTGAGGSIHALALAADGQVVAGGDFLSFNGLTRYRLVRLNANGSVDPMFSPTVDGSVQAVAVQPDGKVLLAGGFSAVNGVARSRVARVNADGTLDATFDPGSGPNAYVLSLVLQPDGRVLLGGYFSQVNGVTRNRVVRLNSNGAVDSTFVPGTLDNGYVNSVVVGPDGKIVLCGGLYFGLSSRVLRLHATGAVDTTFNPVINAINSDVTTAAMQSDGKVLIGGYFTFINGVSRSYIARLDVNGNLDSSFNPGVGANDTVWSMAFEPEGTVVLAGAFTSYAGVARSRVTRIYNLFINRPPVMTHPGSVMLLEDAVGHTLNLTGIASAVVPEVGQSVTNLTATSSNPALLPHPLVTYTNGATNATLALSPAANLNGTVFVTVVAQDNGGTADGGVDRATNTFTVNILPVNDAPSFALTASIKTVPFGSGAQSFPGFATSISAGPSDESGQTVSFLVANSSNALFSAQPAISSSGTLTFTPVAGVSGTATVTVLAQDDGGTANGGVDTSAAQIFTVTVGLPNQPPEIVFATNNVVRLEDSGAASVSSFATFSPGSGTDSTQTVSVVSVTAANAGLFSSQPALAANGTLTFTPAANANGSSLVTVIVQDNGGTANGGVDRATNTFTISVMAVNDAPSFALPAGSLSPAGVTWTARESNRVWWSMASSSDGSKLVAIANGGQIYTSTDSGATWTARENNRAWQGVASSADGTKLVAAANGGQLYTSADSGVTWTARESNRAWTGVASSADGSKLVALVNFGPIYTSTDSGVTWTARESGRNWYSVASSSDGSKLVAVVYGGTVFTSTDSGVTWTARESNRSWYSVASSADGSKLVATVQFGQIYTSTDSGATWTARESNRGWVPVASSSDGSKLMAAEYGGQIYTSADSGETWTARESNRAWYSLASSSDGSHLAAGVINGQIYTSAGSASPYVLTVNEDSGAYVGGASFATGLSTGPADESAQVVSFTVNNDNNGLFSSQPAIAADGTLTFTPVAGQSGTATVTVVAQDDGGTANGGVDTSAAQTFTITVTPVNHAPSVTFATNNLVRLEDSGAASVASFATFNPGSGPDSTQTVSVVSVTAASTSLFSSQPALAANGTLTFTPAANANGSSLVTVIVQDNGGTANGGVDRATNTFTIAVTPVNDAPSFVLPGATPSYALRAWGYNAQGQVGNGTTTEAHSPVAVGTATNWQSVAVGDVFSLALKADGTLWAWGYGGDDALGLGTQANQPNPVQVGTASDWRMVAAGREHGLAVKQNGTLWSWGLNFVGQLGDGTTTRRETPVQVGTANDWQMVSGGQYHTVALKQDGTLWAWGRNIEGQLGDGQEEYNPTNVFSPKQIGTANDWQTVVAGRYHTLGLKRDGTLWAWGSGSSGLGTGTTANQRSPVQVGTASDWQTVAAGVNHSVAVKTDGTLWAWGANSRGQLGDGTTTGRPSPVQIGTATDWRMASADGDSTVAVKQDGTLWAWGYNAQGQLGNGTTTEVHSPVQVGTATDWVSVSAGAFHVVAMVRGSEAAPYVLTVLENAGPQTVASVASSILAGSANETGQVVDFQVSNNNNALFSSQPALVANGTLTFTPAANAYGSATVTILAHDDGGTANGGVDTSAPQTFTITVTPVNHAPSVTFATNNLVRLEDSGAASVSGFGTFSPGSGGLDSTQTVSVVSVTAANTGLFSSQPAIAANGTLTFTPAANANGSSLVTVIVQDNGGTANGGVDRATNTFTLTVTAVNDAPSFAVTVGHGLTTNINQQVVAWGGNNDGQTNVPGSVVGPMAVAAGYHYSLALLTNGTVVAWGNNGNGQANVPGGLTGVTKIAAGSDHGLALKSDGTVVAWGANGSGQANVPGGLSGVTAIAGGASHSLALKSDGTVVGWGWNAFGQSSSPGALSGVTATAIAAGWNHSLALKSDGTVVAWGFNGSGQANVPGGLSGVVAIAAGGNHSLALKSDGTVAAWGWNSHGQITVPGGLSGVVKIAAGTHHSLALKSDGTVVVWGNNDSGQGVVPAGLTGATEIAGGAYHNLVLAVTQTTVGLAAVTAVEGSGSFSLANAVTNILAGPVNESAQVVSFTVNNDNIALFSSQPAIGTNGTLNFTPAAGASGSATVTVLAQDDGGTANGGVDTSAPQTFTITVTLGTNPPVIVQQPAALSLAVGGAGMLSVGATGGGPLAYQWFRNGSAVAGATSAALAFSNAQVASAGNYYAVVTNGYGAATSSVVRVSVGGTLNDDLVAWYRLDGDLLDYSGNARHGTAVNFTPSYLTGPVGQALKFAGNSQNRVDLQTWVPGTNSFTFSGWVKYDSTNEFGHWAYGTAVTLFHSGASDWSHGFAVTINLQANGTVTPGFGVGSTSASSSDDRVVFNTSVNLASNVWHHLAGVMDRASGEIRIYWNGALLGTTSVAGFGPINSTWSHLGGYNNGQSHNVAHSARQDDVRIYSRALGEAEILSLASALHLTSQPASQTVYVGQSAALTVTALGTEPLSYQWRKGGDAIAGATNASLAFAAVTLADAGAFDVVVTDSTGSVTSSIATLAVLSPNAAPSVAFVTNNVGVLEDAGAQSVAGFASFSAGAVSESNQVVTVASVTAASTALFSSQPAIAANGTLTFTPAANANGSSLVTVVVQDNGGTGGSGVDSATNTFTLTVTAVNDAPSFTLPAGPSAGLSLWAWGYNGYGELGDGTTTSRSSPVQVGTVTDWASVAAGGYHMVARKSDGTLWVWGANFAGQLGDGTTTHRSSPVQIGTATTWASVAAGTYHTVACKSDGTLWAWGDNNSGQLADGTFTSRTSPVQVGTAADWVSVAAGWQHTVARKSDGTLWAWGRNNEGQLGDGTFTYRTSPVQIGTATDWVSIDAGNYHTVARRSDGTIWAWGGNGQGQLGDGTTTSRGSPVQVGTATDWASVVAGDLHSLAIKSDGTLWAWGDNGFGQLGDGTFNYRTSPVQIGTATDWASVAAGNYHTVARKSGGTLWAWGYNGQGQLGDGTTTFRTSPVQIGTASNWALVDAGAQDTVALAGSLDPGPYYLTALEDGGPQSVAAFATSISAGPANESAQVVSFTVNNDNTALFSSQPAIGTNGTLNFTPAATAFGSATVTVIAQDDGGTANGGVDTSAAQTFTITVNAVNDAPSFALAGTNLTVFASDGAVARSAWATNISAGPANEAAQSVSFVVTNNDNSKFTVQPTIAANGSLTFTPAANATGVVTVGVRAVDSGGTANGGVDTSAVQTFTVTLAASKVVLPAAFAAGVGDSISVPVSLLGAGIENGVAFTVTYPAAQLTYTGASAGGSSAGATVLANTSTAGQAGALVFRALGTTWPAGSNEVVFLHFTVAAGAGGATVPLAFADGVVTRQVSDVNAVDIAPVLYVDGAVQAAAPGVLEGDVSPRPTGSGTVTVTDAIQISRFAAGLDSVTNFGAGGEFQRADVAPRATLGDGRLTVADAIQAQRYAAGLDPATAAGGPTGLGGTAVAAVSAKLSAGARVVRVVGGQLVSGRANSVTVQVDAQGNEAGLSLSLAFDPGALTFVSAAAGQGASGGTVVVNAGRAASGRVGLVLMLPAGTSLAAGTRDVVTLTFNVTGSGATSISVTGDSPVAREVADVNANVLGASFVGGSFNIVLPAGLQAAGMERAADGSLRLVIRTAAGTAITAAQAAKYVVHVTTNLGGAWTVLPNALVVENGALKIVDPAANGAGLRLYKLVETP